MKYQQGFVDLDLTSFFIFLIAMGILIGVMLTTGVPIIWEWIKPFIHAWTA